MNTQYNVVFTGQLIPGFSQEEVVDQMVEFSKLAKEKVERLISSEKQAILKRNVSNEVGSKYKNHLEKIGLNIELMKVVTKDNTPTSKIPQTKNPTQSPDSQGSLQESKPVTNLYAAPQADLAVETSEMAGFSEEPQKVKASHGWRWIQQACKMFFAKPFLWLGMVFVSFFLAFITNLIPIIGMIIYSIIFPVFAGGLMMAAYNQDVNQSVKFSDIFSGFKRNLKQLLLLGLIYILTMILLIAIIMLPMFGSGIFAFFGFGGNPQAAVEAMEGNMMLFGIMYLVGMLIYIPIIMALWFAPCLVIINEKSAITAFKLSFLACKRNVLPYLVYGLVFFGLVSVFGIIMGIGSAISVGIAGDSTSGLAMFIPMIFMILVSIPIGPITILSIYTSYKDIFYTTK